MGCGLSTIDTLDAPPLDKKIELLTKPNGTLLAKKKLKNSSDEDMPESDADVVSTPVDAEYAKVVHRRQLVISQSLLHTRL
ncbi:hypothetical protein Gpo141_00014235 [Globisporangium polare]